MTSNALDDSNDSFDASQEDQPKEDMTYRRENDIKTWLVGEQSHEQIKKMAEKILLEQLAHESTDQCCLHPAFVVSNGNISQWDMFADESQATKFRPYVGALLRGFVAKLMETVGGPSQADAVGFIVEMGIQSEPGKTIPALYLEMKNQPSYLLIPTQALLDEPIDEGCQILYKVMGEEDKKYFPMEFINEKLIPLDLSGKAHITIKLKEEVN